MTKWPHNKVLIMKQGGELLVRRTRQKRSRATSVNYPPGRIGFSNLIASLCLPVLLAGHPFPGMANLIFEFFPCSFVMRTPFAPRSGFDCRPVLASISRIRRQGLTVGIRVIIVYGTN